MVKHSDNGYERILGLHFNSLVYAFGTIKVHVIETLLLKE